jgi:glycosyltransferase involved in cell wall biosynthesis
MRQVGMSAEKDLMQHFPVSVVIPAFNYAQFLPTAIESALRQTIPASEIIVVDDGSTDHTGEVVARYGNAVSYIYQENSGLSAARNTGIRHARGEWVAFLDADDKWHAQKTEVQLCAIVRHGGNYDVIGSSECGEMPGGDIDKTPLCREVTLREFLLKPPMTGSSIMVRKRCFEKCGYFNEELKSVEDRDMWLRLASRFRCLQVDSPCWWYRTHPHQMNKNAARMLENYARVLDEFFAGHPEYRGLSRLAYAYMYSDAAWSHFAEGQRFAAVKYMTKSLMTYPGPLNTSKRMPKWLRAKCLVRYLLGPRSLNKECAVT